MKLLVEAVILITYFTLCQARIHKLEISSDGRKYIALSKFGYYKGGYLDVSLKNFHMKPQNESALIGFSLDRTINDAMSPYLNSHQDYCTSRDPLMRQNDAEVFFFILDFQNGKLIAKCNDSAKINVEIKEISYPGCNGYDIDIDKKVIDKEVYYNTSFKVVVATLAEQGLYHLYFFNCQNYNDKTETLVDFTIDITEWNLSGYLSAGEMPLPALYCMMSILFLLSGMFWVFLLRQSKHPVFKIHYIMALLVFLKTISIAFKGVNYHYIQQQGFHAATWAVLFYVAHLLKGALLFVVIVLIGTGWTFIKHILSPKEKRLFMAVIPLQVLANIAEIILEEGEEGAREHNAWRDIFILVDLLCCGCILFPVVWSIRHLQEVSLTDDKAAINLRKLKLFRHFYVMIVCYIYSTRIIVYLLQLAVPFQYGWLDEMFREKATYVFFVLTAYKFRPASHNPYFSVSDDEDDDMDQAITESGALEGLSRVNSRKNKLTVTTMTEVTEEEKDALLSKESSHEYD